MRYNNYELCDNVLGPAAFFWITMTTVVLINSMYSVLIH